MKRKLFDEIAEGFEALAKERHGKRTLRTHTVEINPAPTLRARELIELRERLNLSRAVFARYLRTNPRTLENWEQGLVERYPDTVARLARI
jgi:putative transcriptional regulator